MVQDSINQKYGSYLRYSKYGAFTLLFIVTDVRSSIPKWIQFNYETWQLFLYITKNNVIEICSVISEAKYAYRRTVRYDLHIFGYFTLKFVQRKKKS
jgi:hypothetical protein